MSEKMKSYIKPTLVLGVICIAVALLVAAINLIAEPIIKKAEEQKIFDSYRVVLDGDFEELKLEEGAPSSVTKLLKVTENGELKGHVVTLVTKGYAGDISITVGIDKDGKITKAVVTNQSESHGKAGMANYTDRFMGVGADTVADVDTFTGATVSSSAIKGAIIDAVNFVTGSSVKAPDEPEEDGGAEPSLPKTDEEIKSIMAQMAGSEATFTDVYLYNAPTALKRLWTAGDAGIFAYVVVPGQYVPVATEAIIHLNNECEIIKVNMLSWIVGHGVGYGNWNDEFIGTDKDTVSEVELVTGATGTSSDFRGALEEALPFIEKTVDRTEKSIYKYMKQLVPMAKDFEPMELPTGAEATFKALYRAVGTNGYVAYLVTSTQYVAKESETLVYINSNGRIGNINLLSWTVGHGVEPGNFALGFIGMGENDIDDVDGVTAATGTSNNIKAAVKNALEVVEVGSFARVVGVVTICVALIATVAAIVIFKKRRAVK